MAGTLNEFLREGAVAAHLVARSAPNNRLVVAFPAGNSGAALWFEEQGKWGSVSELEPATRPDSVGDRRGIEAVIEHESRTLTVQRAAVGSVRLIRDLEGGKPAPPQTVVTPKISGRAVVWERRRLDGGAGYYLSVEVLDGWVRGGPTAGSVVFDGGGGPLRMKITALTGDDPVTPIPSGELFLADTNDEHLRHILMFLAHEEALFAGSWQYNTYFGRDTLLSLQLLAPVAAPRLIEAGLSSVIERVSPQGEVAHEENVGEYALLNPHLPVHDYTMVDDDFQLAPLLSRYLLDTNLKHERAREFLRRRAKDGNTYGDKAARNFRFVIESAQPFGAAPHPQHLISFKPGKEVGQWRDSDAGNAHGRYAYDVNAVWVPAALTAIARLVSSGLLSEFGLGRPASAAALAEVWRQRVPPLFEVTIPYERARTHIISYAAEIGVDTSPALEALTGNDFRFHALSLNDNSHPIPVVHSDQAFELLLFDPAPEKVQHIVNTMIAPFPLGLVTGVGLVVANPVFATRAIQAIFGNTEYHGTVVWAWQQVLFMAGLDRQLRRTDLPADVFTTIESARRTVHDLISASAQMHDAELWTWEYTNDRYRPIPFGQRSGDAAEANAAQLWSTAKLSVTH